MKRWLIGCGAVALVAILALVIWIPKKHKTTKNNVVVYSTDKPSEDKPDESYTWRGKAEDPKKIIIPSLGIDGYIQNVGIDQNKEVAVPNNIHVAGWFVDTVLPGQKGLSIIDGHVDGRRLDGIFKNLATIKPGAEINIEFGNGSKKTFTTIKTQTMGADQAAAALFSQEPTVSSQLNLITCIGNFDEKTKRYEQRVIVSTQLKE